MRWALSMDQVIIPRSHNREHIFENFRVLQGDCEVGPDELNALGVLEQMGVDRIMMSYETSHRIKVRTAPRDGEGG